MTADSSVAAQSEDPVSKVLKWVLLGVGIVTFAILAWTVKLTYEAAPPFPERFVARDGAVLMTASNIRAGKAVDDRQGAGTIDSGAASLDQGDDAGGIARHRPDPTRG
jgi:hypothetical protein